MFVDGVYLMLDQVTGEANTPQALTNITRGLKRVAQKLDIPVIITTQTLLWKMKAGKVTADSIGYSSSFFQDSDVIMGLEPVEANEQVRTLKIVQSRNSAPAETSITWNWDTGCFHDEADATSCKFCSPWGMR
jgi:replicative DNA helicase